MATHIDTASARPAQRDFTQNADTDPHPAWLAEYRELHRRIQEDETVDAADYHPSWRRYEELEQLIASTPATTLAGVRAQVDLALECIVLELRGTNLERQPEVVGLRNAVVTLEMLTAAEERLLAKMSEFRGESRQLFRELRDLLRDRRAEG